MLAAGGALPGLTIFGRFGSGVKDGCSSARLKVPRQESESVPIPRDCASEMSCCRLTKAWSVGGVVTPEGAGVICR